MKPLKNAKVIEINPSYRFEGKKLVETGKIVCKEPHYPESRVKQAVELLKLKILHKKGKISRLDIIDIIDEVFPDLKEK